MTSRSLRKYLSSSISSLQPFSCGSRAAICAVRPRATILRLLVVVLTVLLLPGVIYAQSVGVWGDVNGDGRVSAVDAQAVLASVVGLPLPAGFTPATEPGAAPLWPNAPPVKPAKFPRLKSPAPTAAAQNSKDAMTATVLYPFRDDASAAASNSAPSTSTPIANAPSLPAPTTL